MAIERLVTMAIQVGRRDAVWMGVVRSRLDSIGIQYRYESYYGRRGATLQRLRTQRRWSTGMTAAVLELRDVAGQKESEGYQHIDWTQTRYGLSGQVRLLADGQTVPETARTGRVNPITLMPAPDSGALAPHLYTASTLRDSASGEFRCGTPGCLLLRGAPLHTQHLNRHPFLRGAGGYCVDCRQLGSHSIHRQPTILERSQEFAATQRREWVRRGSLYHVFVPHEEFATSLQPIRPLCSVCGSIEDESAHDKVMWQSQRTAIWERDGRRPHDFSPNLVGFTGTAAHSGLLCDICGLIRNDYNGVHQVQDAAEVRVWQRFRLLHWEDTGRDRHDFIPSNYRGTSRGGALCIVCGFLSENSNGSHTGRTNESAGDRLRYAELNTWVDRQYLAWVSDYNGRKVHEFKESVRFSDPLRCSGATLCDTCGMPERNRENNHGSDKPVAPTPYQYEPVVRRRRQEPGF